MRIVLHSIAIVIGLGMSGLASAQSTWNMTGGCTQNAAHTGNFGNVWVCPKDTGAVANATISAWSESRGDSNLTYHLSGTGWASAALTNNGDSGFGIANRTEANSAGGLNVGSPNHSADNITPGAYDIVMVKFDTAMILSHIGAGWGADDSDATVMRWTGSSAPTTSTGTVKGGGSNLNLTSTIGAGGWELVGNFSNLCAGKDANGNCTDVAGSQRATAASLASSYWLIAAYNTTMGAGGAVFNSATDDGFKLNYLRTALYSCPGGGLPGVGGQCGAIGVPEPGSLALLALAGFGFATTRRRAQR